MQKSRSKFSYSLNDFIIHKVIGRGCIGKVLLVEEKLTGQFYALKSIRKVIGKDNYAIHAKTERDLLLTYLRHENMEIQANPNEGERKLSKSCPYLIKLYATFQSPTHLFFLLEYHPGGDLATQLSITTRFPEDLARFWIAEILIGLENLHSIGIVYRDLKPENILVDIDGHLVLTDFGLAKILHVRPKQSTDARQETDIDAEFDQSEGWISARTFCGTSEYLAPEVLLGYEYGLPVDIWSLGTLLYEFLYGVTPYWSESQMEMYKKIVVNGGIPFSQDNISESAKNLIKRLLQSEPAMRPSVQEIKQDLFFKSIDWTRLENREILSPVRPHIENEADVQYFDAAFTEMTPIVTPADRVDMLPNSMVQQYFANFSYSSSSTRRQRG